MFTLSGSMPKASRTLLKQIDLLLGLIIAVLEMTMSLGAAKDQHPVGPGSESLKDVAGIDLSAAGHRYPVGDPGGSTGFLRIRYPHPKLQEKQTTLGL